jgi:hypothetical protein
MNITDSQNQAISLIIELIADALGNNREAHAATVVSTAGRLTGSFLLRSFDFDLTDVKPGTVMLSNEANEMGPKIVDLVGAVIEAFGVTIDREKMNSIKPEKSQLNFLEALEKVQDAAIAIMQIEGLSYEQMTECCAIATAFLVKDSKDVLIPESGFTTAILGIIEGSKTAPPNDDFIESETPKPETPKVDIPKQTQEKINQTQEKTTSPKKKKWYQFW